MVGEIPEEITLAYRRVGDTHVFTARQYPGLHIGSSSLAKAFEQATIGLSEHVSAQHNCKVTYGVDLSFAEFERMLAGENAVLQSFVIAKMALAPHSPCLTAV